mgnify:CR=1 FL=1
MAGANALEIKNVVRTFVQGGVELHILRGVSLAVGEGEVVAVVGPSGAGKSTLLQIAGLLDRPDQAGDGNALLGEIIIGGANCGELSDDARTRLRRSEIGFVYQFHHLLPEFTAVENVMLPQMIAGVPRGEARVHAVALLERFGLGARTTHRPAELSGGEQQRTALARALANGPTVLLADEPTGNLDQSTADAVFSELVTLANDRGVAAVVATHNERLAARADRRVILRDGVLVPG